MTMAKKLLAKLQCVEAQQAMLIDGIGKLAAAAGIIKQDTAVTGPQALMLLQDLSEALAAVKGETP